MQGISRKTLYHESGRQCHYCGIDTVLRKKFRHNLNLFTKDHILPRKLGGRSVKSNFVGACKSCNTVKGHMHPNAFHGRYTRDTLRARHDMPLKDWKRSIDEGLICKNGTWIVREHCLWGCGEGLVGRSYKVKLGTAFVVYSCCGCQEPAINLGTYKTKMAADLENWRLGRRRIVWA